MLINIIKKKLKGRSIITDNDLTALPGAWVSDNQRYSSVKRALAKGDLIHIKRGVYCLGDELREGLLNLYAVSNLIYAPSYVSLTSALSYHGVIPEAVRETTAVSAKRQASFKTPFGRFSYNKIPKRAFLAGVKRIKKDNDVFLIAEPIKAILDYAYVHKTQWRSIEDVKGDLRTDEDFLKGVTKKQMIEFKKLYNRKNVSRLIDGLLKEKK